MKASRDARAGVVRIGLVCGSLEAGRDGVGDYTLRLGRALGAQGVDVRMLALADRFVSAPSPAGEPRLRLPASLPRPHRAALARAALAEWAPDWLSLQFVSWNHGWKGVIGGEAKAMRQAFAGRPLHLMLHEPWVTGALEMAPSLTARTRRALLGRLQRRSIVRLITDLAPRIVCTSNAVYQDLLARAGIAALQLPLFGNIALHDARDWDSVRALVRSRSGLELGPERERLLLVGLFGAVRPCPLEPALRLLVAAAAGRRPVLLSLGEAGPGGRERLLAWQRAAEGLAVGQVGPLDPEALSACFRSLDAAISLHPARVVGRSGAAAALLEHGVPVISPWGPPPTQADAFARRWEGMLWPADGRLIERLRAPPSGKPCPDMAAATARQLLSWMAPGARRECEARAPRVETAVP